MLLAGYGLLLGTCGWLAACCGWLEPVSELLLLMMVEDETDYRATTSLQ
jgi:hypothetical protein